MTLHSSTRGSGPRLALLHGFTQTGRCWGPFRDDLAGDHEVVAVDLPGHGRSADVRVDLLGAAHLVAGTVGRAVYVGYSQGGRVLLHLALTRPELVRGIVLIGATAGLDDPAARAARRAADEALADRIERDGVAAFLDEWLAQPLFAGLPPDRAFRSERLDNTAAGLASALRLCGTGTQEPLWDRLSAIASPTLVLAGAHDEAYGRLGRRLAGAIGSAATFAEVPCAGHAAHLEQPAATLAAVRPWLASLPGETVTG